MPSDCVMPGLCPELLGQACRIFLKLAYPSGVSSIPVTKRADASTLSVVKLVKGNLAKFQSVVPELGANW